MLQSLDYELWKTYKYQETRVLMHIHPCQQQKGEKNQSEDLEMDKIKISDAMVLTSAQVRTYKAAFHRSRDESANNDNDVNCGGGVDARP